jgi:hypothetical protein
MRYASYNHRVMAGLVPAIHAAPLGQIFGI